MPKQVGDCIATTLKRSAAKRVSYDNTKLRPRSKPPTGSHLGTVKPTPNPKQGGLMPVAMERKLKAQAKKKFGSASSERARKYVYGTLRRSGWKPSREK